MSGVKGKKGWRMYARIARALIDEPRTAGDLAVDLGMHLTTFRLILRRMHRIGLLHIGGWTKTPRRGHIVPVWHFGQGADVPTPPNAIAGDGRPLSPSAELITFKAMLAELAEGACTSQMLADYCGTNAGWTDKFLKYMRTVHLVRVAAWSRDTPGHPVPMFAFEPDSRDAPRPVPISRQAIDQRNWARRKARKQQLQILQALAANSSVFNLARQAA